MKGSLAGKEILMNNVTIIPAQEKISASLRSVKKLRVAAYVRVSTLSSEQEDSLENQRQHYEEIVGNNPRLDLIKIYADQASGLNTKKRTQFNTMMRDARAGKFDVLYVKSISRFARNTVTTLTAIRELNSYGIETRFEKENLTSTDPSTNLLLSIMASMAESESISISENVNLGLKYKYSRGEWSANFTNFLGYDKLPDGTIAINEEEAETVREIYSDFLSGMSLEHVAKKLTAEGRKTGTGASKWTKTGLLRIISNIKYSGDVIQGITTTVDVINKKRVINNGEAPQYFIKNGIPAIIDKQTYYLAKGELSRREKMFMEGNDTKGPAVYAGKYPFTRKIVCPSCGNFYNHRKARGVDVWECYGRINGSCTAEILKEEELTDAVLKAGIALWELKPVIRMNDVPLLSSKDTEDQLISAAALYMENAFAKRTQDFLSGKRPSEYNPEVVRTLVEKITASETEILVTFYGADPVRVERTRPGRNIFIGRKLKRS